VRFLSAARKRIEGTAIMTVETPPELVGSPVMTSAPRRVRPPIGALLLAAIAVTFLVLAAVNAVSGAGQPALFSGLVGAAVLVNVLGRFVERRPLQLAKAGSLVGVGLIALVMAAFTLGGSQSVSQNGVLWGMFAIATLYLAFYQLLGVLKSDRLAVGRRPGRAWQWQTCPRAPRSG
jgi:hypothetical protein